VSEHDRDAAGAGVRSVMDEELGRLVRLRDLKIAMELGLRVGQGRRRGRLRRRFLSQLAVERELRLGSLAIAGGAGIEPARDFSTVRASGTELSRTTAVFLAWAKASRKGWLRPPAAHA
jgi:hypothetical protein